MLRRGWIEEHLSGLLAALIPQPLHVLMQKAARLNSARRATVFAAQDSPGSERLSSRKL